MTSLQRFSPQNRRYRKLPTVVRRNRNSRPPSPTSTFYTYQNALAWVRSQQDVISRFIQLLQTYPNLIQDESTDRFWEFLEPLLPEEKETKSRETSSDMDTSDNSSNSLRLTGVQVLRPGVNHFKVMNPSDNDIPRAPLPNQLDFAPRLQVISRPDGSSTQEDALFHRAVIGALQEDFFVRVHAAPYLSQQDSNCNPTSSDPDLCVYLFTDSTFENTGCLRTLCAAISRATPVVYVKRQGQQLPDNFSVLVRRSTQGYNTVKEFLSAHLDQPPLQARAPVKKRLHGKDPVREHDPARRPSSARERNKDGRDGGRRGKRRHSPAPVDNSEVARILASGFSGACAIGEADVKTGFDRLKQMINKALRCSLRTQDLLYIRPDLVAAHAENSYSNAANDHLQRPPSRTPSHKPSLLNISGTQEHLPSGDWRHAKNSSQAMMGGNSDGHGCHDCGPLFRTSIRTVKLPPLEQQATTYLLFDRNRNADGPRIVEFPFKKPPEFLVNSDLESIDLEPMESPIQFHEIDLSRQVNGRMTPESENSCSSLF
ncbi:hypothetical protein Btru_023752 [Bulinus truncatus]|nr:hypothetical protein Btru_023752 [Bulinus truncatus]